MNTPVEYDTGLPHIGFATQESQADWAGDIDQNAQKTRISWPRAMVFNNKPPRPRLGRLLVPAEADVARLSGLATSGSEDYVF